MSTDAYYDDYWGRGVYPEGSGVSGGVLALLEPHATPSTHCLDVGCGNGRAAGAWLKPRVASYIGVDVSSVAVEEARSLGLDARVIEDATKLPFDDESFDLVVCVEVLEHLLRPDHAATEMLRVLKPGGVLVATVPNAVFWRRRLDAVVGRWHPLGDELSLDQPWRDPHLRFFTPTTFWTMIATAGFEDVHVSGHDGGLLRELPVVRRFGRGGVSSLYRRLERVSPALLAQRINCVARKPAAAARAAAA
jgi:SAM-dependent methyltransferase